MLQTFVSLDTDPGEPEVETGYTIRSTTQADLVGQARVIARAFDMDSKAALTYESIRSGPAYRNDLDLLAIAPDGSAAAFAIAWLDPALRLGLLEPVGCDPDNQQRGLGRALLRTALRRLRELGATRALVRPNGENPAAIALYESVGFCTQAVDSDWTRAL